MLELTLGCSAAQLSKQETEDDVVESVRSALPGALGQTVDASTAQFLQGKLCKTTRAVWQM